MPDDQSSLLNQEAVAGHNQPPEPTPYELAQARVDELVKAANAWLTQVAEIRDDDQAGRANDFLSQLRAMAADSGTLENERKALTKPLNDQVKAINARYGTLRETVNICMDKVKNLITAHLQKKEAERLERERLAREEEERKQREAEEALRKAKEAEEAAARAEQAKREAEEAKKREEEEKQRLAAEAERKKREAEEAEARAREEKNKAEKKRLEEEAERKKREAEEAEKRKAEEAKRLEAETKQAQTTAAQARTEARGTDVIGAAVAANTAVKEAQEASKAANSVAREKTQARGEYAPRAAGLRTVYVVTLTDPAKAFKRYKAHPKVKEVLESLANADVKGGMREIEGFTIEARRTV